ncbi:MAG: hypothetical protein Q7R47_06265, partial [Candidatus Diapherotrites archaeon]|nr:hypothetical protein [Candidatus Diapherotrites archaeon]
IANHTGQNNPTRLTEQTVNDRVTLTVLPITAASTNPTDTNTSQQGIPNGIFGFDLGAAAAFLAVCLIFTVLVIRFIHRRKQNQD